MFIKILNLPPGNCVRGVKHVYTGSEPTSRHKRKYTHTCIIASNSRGLFARVQPVYMVSFPTSRELSTAMQLISTVSEPT